MVTYYCCCCYYYDKVVSVMISMMSNDDDNMLVAMNRFRYNNTISSSNVAAVDNNPRLSPYQPIFEIVYSDVQYMMLSFWYRPSFLLQFQNLIQEIDNDNDDDVDNNRNLKCNIQSFFSSFLLFGFTECIKKRITS